VNDAIVLEIVRLGPTVCVHTPPTGTKILGRSWLPLLKPVGVVT
jgi:hypothetical protein